MKIRTGFVSNSSSSSFVLMTSQEYWDEVKGNLEPFEIAVAEALQSEPNNFCGMSVVSFSTWESASADWSDNVEVDEEISRGNYEGRSDPVRSAWDTVLSKLEKDSSKIHKGSSCF